MKILNPKGIYEKDDERSAQKEKFVPYQGWVYANGPELIEFAIEGVKFICDVQGQKTGFFLDQRINAQNIAKYASNKKV
ncbi:MAG TPA: class I SAM-dependent rRNA methyltransferase, partial [Petrotogaceae bacterium]|nr:class I SAM-dependent rRNA methyltransferase [Petrotogaceae bacterium]